MKNTYDLLKNRGKDAYKANKLMSSKIRSLEQHLDYEAIIQIAEIDDQDLLYLNFDNQALGEHCLALMYLIVTRRFGIEKSNVPLEASKVIDGMQVICHTLLQLTPSISAHQQCALM